MTEHTERDYAESLIAQAASVVVKADCSCPDPSGGHAPDCKPTRDLNADELEELFYCLTMAAVKLKKLPGGEAAAERVYERASAELERRRAARAEPDYIKFNEATRPVRVISTPSATRTSGEATLDQVARAQAALGLVDPPTREQQLADLASARIEAGQLHAQFYDIDHGAIVESSTIVYRRGSKTFHAVIHDATRYDPLPTPEQCSDCGTEIVGYHACLGRPEDI